MRALAHRADHPDLYARGAYSPLEAEGSLADHLIAYARSTEGGEVIAIVPRLVGRLLRKPDDAPIGDRWRGTSIALGEERAGARYLDLMSGSEARATAGENGPMLDAAAVLGIFPVALLHRLPDQRSKSKRKARAS
jgi:(1->4)-alpha-D-glucan 1-alpha-D-glucosylmutase